MYTTDPPRCNFEEQGTEPKHYSIIPHQARMSTAKGTPKENGEEKMKEQETLAESQPK